MERNYWVISPNVHNDSSEQCWKEIISERRNAYIGFGPDKSTGVTFCNEVKEGDLVIVAQGANRNKHCHLAGIVNSPAIAGEEEGTPGYAQRRTLINTLNEQELSALQLNFNGCAYGDANRISALYRLYPLENANDQRIVSSIMTAVNQKRLDDLMGNIKLSTEKQNQIKALWEKYKSDSKGSTEPGKQLHELLGFWSQYKNKIIADSFQLDDYTNTLANASTRMPGGYLCNFLERTTRDILGSSKPGNALNFGVKLNDDNSTYSINKSDNKKFNRLEAIKYFDENIKKLIKKIVAASDINTKIQLVDDADYSAKQILMKMAVLDNLTDFIYIYSTKWIEELYIDFIDGDAEGLFAKNHQVCLMVKKLLGVNEQDQSELILLSRFLWRYVNAKSIADENSPNVILYGPPGTGKTYSVLNSLAFACQGDSSCYEVLQFHPSFTYEDFIEGIKPKGVSKDGNIRFELVNGVFKKFCIKARKNPEKSFYFVVDEINRANLSSVFGETLSLLERDYRHDGESSTNLIRTQYSTLIEDLIATDTSHIDLAYITDNGEVKFGVPKNIYFIGMMNDVDKSIDAFDLALRRRFKWIRKDCDYEVIEAETRFKSTKYFDNMDQYIRSCEKLNEYISVELGLGRSYEFGHSFFMKMSDIAKRSVITAKNLEDLFNLYLRPTLKEYLRSVFSEGELDGKLKDTLDHFKGPIKQ